MFTSMNIQLEATNNTNFTTDSALGIHGLFFQLLEGVNPEISEKLHDLDQLKPYTLSSLKEDRKDYRTQKISRGQLYRFRITVLNEALFKTFYEGLYNYFTSNKQVRIGRGEFRIVNYNIESTTSFEEIIENSNSENKKAKIEFQSPTSFRRLGKNYLFADPEQLLKSYVEKWNTFSPEAYQITDEEKEILHQHCFATQYEMKTELTDMGKYKIVGFRGECQYQLDKTTPQEIITIFNRLLKFIPYSGTGYKTTMGMGQTRVVMNKGDEG